MPMPLRNLKTVNWEAVRHISQVVQQDLEKSGFQNSTDYHCVFELWENELRKKSLNAGTTINGVKISAGISTQENDLFETVSENQKTNLQMNEEKRQENVRNNELFGSHSNAIRNGEHGPKDDQKHAEDPELSPTCHMNGYSTEKENTVEWYDKVAEYWENEKNCPANIGGVLGGYGYVSPIDISGSQQFLTDLYKKYPNSQRHRAIDCGAGIGRVTKYLLSQYYEHIDLLEQSQRLLNQTDAYLSEKEKMKVESTFCMGLQDFEPEECTYDLVWMQWVTPYLIDVDLVSFFQRCRRSLEPGGFICVKENVLENSVGFDIDKVDTSITRSDAYFKSLFHLADLHIVLERIQEGFPDELYKVKTYALMP